MKFAFLWNFPLAPQDKLRGKYQSKNNYLGWQMSEIVQKQGKNIKGTKNDSTNWVCVNKRKWKLVGGQNNLERQPL